MDDQYAKGTSYRRSGRTIAAGVCRPRLPIGRMRSETMADAAGLTVCPTFRIIPKPFDFNNLGITAGGQRRAAGPKMPVFGPRSHALRGNAENGQKMKQTPTLQLSPAASRFAVNRDVTLSSAQTDLKWTPFRE